MTELARAHALSDASESTLASVARDFEDSPLVLRAIETELARRSGEVASALRQDVQRRLGEHAQIEKLRRSLEGIADAERVRVLAEDLQRADETLIRAQRRGRAWLARYTVGVGDRVALRAGDSDVPREVRIAAAPATFGEVAPESPFAKAVLGREVGERVDVPLGGTTVAMKIVAIRKPNGPSVTLEG